MAYRNDRRNELVSTLGLVFVFLAQGPCATCTPVLTFAVDHVLAFAIEMAYAKWLQRIPSVAKKNWLW